MADPNQRRVGTGIRRLDGTYFNVGQWILDTNPDIMSAALKRRLAGRQPSTPESASKRSSSSSSSAAVIEEPQSNEKPPTITEEDISALTDDIEQEEKQAPVVNGEHNMQALPMSPVKPTALVATVGSASALTEQAMYHLEPLQFHHSQKLREWYSLPKRRMNPWQIPMNWVTLQEIKYEGKKFADMLKKYPRWKKTRDAKVRTYEPFCRLDGEKVFGFEVVLPFMHAQFAKWGPVGNMLDMGDFDPKNDKLHITSKSLTLTDKAFDNNTKTEDGKNPDTAFVFDWLTQINQHLRGIMMQEAGLCQEVKDAVKKKIPQMKLDAKQMNEEWNEQRAVFKAMLGQWRPLVTEWEGTRQIKLTEKLFRYRNDDEQKRFATLDPATGEPSREQLTGDSPKVPYVAPTVALQEAIKRMSVRDYAHYENGKHANMVVNEVPVYLKKTRDEILSDFAEFKKTRDPAKAFPWRRISYTDASLLGPGAVVAPHLQFELDEGGASRPAGLRVNIVALFWDREAGVNATLQDDIEEPFLLD